MSEFAWADLSMALYVLVLASFVGFEVISKVPTMLHTPLMSGSNAISGIILLGALVISAHQEQGLGAWLGYIAIFFAAINVVGGFWVTDRMLAMFSAKSKDTKNGL